MTATASSFETLLMGVDDDGVCTITLNRPDKLNALNRAVIDELEQAFGRARDEDDVRGVILTGSGDRAFAAGADIRQFLDLDQKSGRDFARRGQAVFDAIEQFPKPVVAAVNGFALGGGCELAMACHLRVAADTAQFGQPEVGLGLIPGYGGTQRLPRLVGLGIATELILTGQRIDARRAYEIGLVNRVAPADSLLAAARELLLAIAGQSPVAVTLALEALRTSDQPLADGLDGEASLFARACASDDFREGVAAFLEKRKAEFRGR